METNSTDHREPAALARLVIRSVLLGAVVPVTQEVIPAVLLCLILYGIEKVIVKLFRMQLNMKPLYLAGYRGGLMYALLNFMMWNNYASAVGASIGGGLAAMFLFILEDRIVIFLAKKKARCSQQK